MSSDQLYRQFIAVICLAAFIAQTFSKTFIVADYYTHQAKYAKSCENRNRPKEHCYGRCQLVKKLQQEEQKEQENPNRKAVNKYEVIAFPGYSATVTCCLRPEEDHIKNTIPLSDGNSTDLSFSIFHPPRG